MVKIIGEGALLFALFFELGIREEIRVMLWRCGEKKRKQISRHF